MTQDAGPEGGNKQERRRQPMFDCEREEDGYVFHFRPPRVSSEFLDHLGAARREVLLAFRSLIDEAIDRSERGRSQGGGPHNIQVS